MDSKVTLSFDEAVIEKAKKFADSQHISLSRLTEFLYRKITNGDYENLESLPVADWVNSLSEGETQYKTKTSTRKKLKKEYLKSRKK